ncbi:hypothetical protein NJB93_21445, partial [Brucella intermedia]|nr:hypothetical protein [Brucella intermedia]
QVRVDGVEDDVTAQANLITQLSSNIGEVSANATFRMGTYAAPSGWNSRIGMEVRGGTNDSYKSAGLFLDVTSTQARIALIAEQIVFSNGTEFFKPFVIQNNVMYGEGFVMDWAKIVNVQIQWAQIQNAVVNNLIVGTSNLDFNAVTASSQMTYTGTYPSNVHIMGTLVVNSPQGNTGLLDWSCNGRIYGQSSIVSSTTIRLINSTTGVELKSFIVTKPAGTDSQNFTLSTMAIDASAIPGNNTYIVRKGYADNVASGNVEIYNTSYLKSLVWKR